MVYHVSTDKFSGPLDMLLSMIEERKLSINEISLADIAGDFLSHVKELPHLPEREVSQFLVIAATLMLIKSRSLLPRFKIDVEEEADIKELEERLRQLKLFRQLSHTLRLLASRHAHMFSRDTIAGLRAGFYPPEGFAFFDIMETAEAIVARLPKEEKLSEYMLERVVTIEEKIRELTERIQRYPEQIFSALADREDKLDIIVSFLALLELLKDGIIIAEQKGLFGDIRMIHAKTRTNN